VYEIYLHNFIYHIFFHYKLDYEIIFLCLILHMRSAYVCVQVPVVSFSPVFLVIGTSNICLKCWMWFVMSKWNECSICFSWCNEHEIIRYVQLCAQTTSDSCTSHHHMRHIHKISSVCKYCCCCNAAVTMVRMRAEFVRPFGRHGRNLQTTEPCLCIVLGV
jgi:hypothetical protein